MSDEFLTIDTQDKSVLKNLSALGEQLKSMYTDMLIKKEAAAQAEKEYKHFANVVLPMEMVSAGVQSIGLMSGGTMKLTQHYYCQPNKNVEDQQKIAKWVIENGGDFLLNHMANVSPENIDKLKANDIAFVDSTTFNTASLKAFIKDKLAPKTGTPSITIDDIPACIHFQEVSSVEIAEV